MGALLPSLGHAELWTKVRIPLFPARHNLSHAASCAYFSNARVARNLTGIEKHQPGVVWTAVGVSPAAPLLRALLP